jgi:predicted DNA-binding protein
MYSENTRGQNMMAKKFVRRGNPMVRAIVSKELEAKLRALAKKERRTLSQMIALILERGVETWPD